MDSLAEAQDWTSLSWTPTLPFYKALPRSDSIESHTEYSGLSSDTLLNGIQGLWHFDDVAPSGAGSVADSARFGFANNATPNGGVTFGKEGLFGSAASFDGSSGYVIATQNISAAHVTISVWTKITAYPASQAVIAGFASANGSAIKDKDLFIDSTGHIRFFVYDNVSDKFTSASTAVVPLNTWVHVVGTADGTHAYIYLNGTQLGSVAAGDTFIYGGPDFIVGGSNQYATYLAQTVDEVAVWNRALDSAEVLQLYRRGANRIKYQVRSCSDATCASGSPAWLGPDGTNQSYFSELYNTAVNSLTGAVQAILPSMTFANFAGLTVTNNRYFQYRAIMESDDNNSLCNYGSGDTPCSPELKTVSIGPDHYPSSAIISNQVGQKFSSLSSFAANTAVGESPACTAGVKYQFGLSSSGPWKYYDTGSNSWAAGDDTTATANTIAALSGAAMQRFSSQVGNGDIFFRAFLNSDGHQPCELGDVAITGNE